MPLLHRSFFAPVLMALVGATLYANSLQNPFVFDDLAAIAENDDLRQILPLWLDPDASKNLEEIFIQGGMVVRHSVHAERVETTPSGVSVFLDDGTLVQGDVLLVAAGRVPNVEDLNLAVTGVEPARWGTGVGGFSFSEATRF